VLLDVNALAGGHKYCVTTAVQASPKHDVLGEAR
jgi:hypothetical protein